MIFEDTKLKMFNIQRSIFPAYRQAGMFNERGTLIEN